MSQNSLVLGGGHVCIVPTVYAISLHMVAQPLFLPILDWGGLISCLVVLVKVKREEQLPHGQEGPPGAENEIGRGRKV